MKKIYLIIAMIFITTSAHALNCGVVPTCDQLGYKRSEADCSGLNFVRCPFDQSKVFCQRKTLIEGEYYDRNKGYTSPETKTKYIYTGKTETGIRTVWIEEVYRTPFPLNYASLTGDWKEEMILSNCYSEDMLTLEEIRMLYKKYPTFVQTFWNLSDSDDYFVVQEGLYSVADDAIITMTSSETNNANIVCIEYF